DGAQPRRCGYLLMAREPDHLSFRQRIGLWLLGSKSLEVGRVAKLTDHDAVSQLIGGATDTGIYVNDEAAMRIATVWSCVRVLAETIGSLPWAIYERQRSGDAVKVEHDLGNVLIASPNRDMTSQEMREAQMMNLCLNGNGYSVLERAPNGRVISI